MLVDRYGKKIKESELKTTQTAKATNFEELLSSHPTKGLTPSGLVSILNAAETGLTADQYYLFEDMEERDPHLFAEISKRRRAVISRDWVLKGPKDSSPQEKTQLEILNQLFKETKNLGTFFLDLLTAIGYGFSCCEIEWVRSDKYYTFENLIYRPQAWFIIDDYNNKILLADTDEGSELWEFGWVVHLHAAKSGSISKSSLYRVLVWPFLMKQFALRDLAEFLEIYGLPTKIGKYPLSATEVEKETLFKAVTQLGRSAAGIMPADMALEFMNAVTGTSDQFLSLVEYCDLTITRAVLGQTLSSSSTSTGLGSGVANLHSDVRADLLAADLDQLEDTITDQVIYPLCAVNGLFGPNRYPKFEFDRHVHPNPNDFTDMLVKLKSLGITYDEAWARSELRIP